MTSHTVQVIKAQEMIQDMEAIELDETNLPAGLPETGIVVNNKTDRSILVTMRRKQERSMSVPPGGSSVMALAPGMYHYSISADEGGKGPGSKTLYVPLRGTRKIVEKCVFVYDVFTRKRVVDDNEFEDLRSR